MRLIKPISLSVLMSLALSCNVEDNLTEVIKINEPAAQEQVNDTFCGTNSTAPVYKGVYLESSSTKSSSESFCLRVYMHVIRKTDKSGGVTEAQVDESFSILENDFAPHNIHFTRIDSINYVDQDHYYLAKKAGTMAEIFTDLSVSRHYDGIDIFIFPDDAHLAMGIAGEGVGLTSALLVSGSRFESCATSVLSRTSAISHEMGHVLGLYHTHMGFKSHGVEDFDSNTCRELIDGSNSTICGDYISDTPADPYLRGEVDCTSGVCIYDGDAVEPGRGGKAYNPDVNNYMSYTTPTCLSQFSNGQVSAMRNAINTIPHLQSTRIIPPSTSDLDLKTGKFDIDLSSKNWTPMVVKSGGNEDEYQWYWSAPDAYILYNENYENNSLIYVKPKSTLTSSVTIGVRGETPCGQTSGWYYETFSVSGSKAIATRLE